MLTLAETNRGADLIAYAGGMTREADANNIEISSFVYVPESRQYERQILRRTLAEVQAQAIGPSDMLRLTARLFDRETGPVTIGGEVRQPGTYDIRRGERLSQLIARAGGLLETAYPYGAVLLRESTKRAEQQSVDASYRELQHQMIDALSTKDETTDKSAVIAAFQQLTVLAQSYKAVGRLPVEADPRVLEQRPDLDIVLEPGDQIVFPKRPASVHVFGEVMSPGAYPHGPGSKLTDYLNAAGGLRDRAQSSKIYAMLPNGVSTPLGSSAWRQATATAIPPGTTIIVPRRPVSVPFLTVLPSLTQILSSAAIAAASIAALN